MSDEFRRPIELKKLAPTGLRDLGENYVSAFVTFIDILGFRAIVDGTDSAKINALLDAMKAFSAQPQRRMPPYDREEHLPIVLQFSDSIIRIQPVNEEDTDIDAIDMFFGEITSLLISQGNLACNGILIRGGMTFGSICVHKERIFGPAFNRAYIIESQLATYPRIVIDEKLCSSSTENPIISLSGAGGWESARQHIFEYVGRTEDGQWSINYLPNLFDAEKDPGVTGEDVLIAHRDSIRRLLINALKTGNESVLAKIRWAASYHNKLIESVYKRINDRHEENGNSLVIDLDGQA